MKLFIGALVLFGLCFILVLGLNMVFPTVPVSFRSTFGAWLVVLVLSLVYMMARQSAD